MKNVTVKRWLVAALATITGVAGFNHAALAQTTAAKYGVNFKQEKTAVSRDIERVNYQQQKVNALKQQCKQNAKAGTFSVATHNDLLKAKADLKRERGYLMADKTSLMIQHQSHIAHHRKDLKEQRADLRAQRWGINKALNKGNSSAVARAEAIVNTKQQIITEKAKLRQAKLDRNNDLLAVNKDIREANGQSVVALSLENGFAQASNLTLK